MKEDEKSPWRWIAGSIIAACLAAAMAAYLFFRR
jgi:hypothetical protein